MTYDFWFGALTGIAVDLMLVYICSFIQAWRSDRRRK